MYECNGWIKLSESTVEVDEGGMDEKCDKLRVTIKELTWSSGRVELLLLNGEYVLVINLNTNRKRSEVSELDSLLERVMNDFKGAYGVLYELNEQVNLEAGLGVYTVRVIKRGGEDIRLDPFLSPINPVVEDE